MARAILDRGQRRGVAVLAGAAAVALVGVTVTGVAVFLIHESDPDWFDYVRGSGIGPASRPSTGWSAAHSFFADAFAVVVLLGGAWFIARVSFGVFRFSVVVFVTTLFAHVSGSVIRFNAVQLEGRALADADRGYLQVFSGEFEYLVTARFELGAFTAALWTATHLATVVILVWGLVISLGRLTESATRAVE